MGHYVMVSLWCASSLSNTKFSFLYLRMNNNIVERIWCSVKKKLPDGWGRPLGHINLTNRNKMVAQLRSCPFFFFCIKWSLHLLSFKVHGLQITWKISSLYSNLYFAHPFVFYWLLQWYQSTPAGVTPKTNHTWSWIYIFFYCNIGKAKWPTGWAKYV